jgi:hypothetical protein
MNVSAIFRFAFAWIRSLVNVILVFGFVGAVSF